MIQKCSVLMLTLIMVLSISGCGGDNAPSAGGAQTASSAPASSQSAAPSAAAQNEPAASEPSYFNATGYPIVNEPVQMRMMYNLNSTRGVEPDRNSVFAYLEELTGIKWEFVTVDSTAWAERLTLMWASEDMPDMIFNSAGGPDTIMRYLRIGKIMDIRPLVEQYAPNVSRLMEENDGLRMSMVTPDGQIGSFFHGNMDAVAGEGQCPPEFPLVNVEWLEKFGLPVPSTPDEVYNTLKTFQTQDANGNGKQDEIGIGFNSWSAKGLRILFPWFGIMADNSYRCYLDGDTVKFSALTEEYVEAVRYIKKLYDEKLIDPEIFTITNAEVTAKGTAEDQVYGMLLCSAGFLIVGEDGANSYDVTSVIQAPNGKSMWYTRSYPAGIGVGVITSNCQYPEAAVRWCDTFYDPSFEKITWMGVEGTAYKMNADGTWEWLYENTEEGTSTAVRAQHTIQAAGAGPSICPPEWFLLNDKAEAPVNAQRVRFAESAGGTLRIPIPLMYFEEDDSKKILEINPDIQAYEDEMFAAFITGEASIDTDYETFVNTLKGMGVEELVSILQKTYDNNKN